MNSSMMDCSASADDVFGPLVAECRRAFDFTALFEDSFLSIIPSALLLLLAPARLIALRGKRRTVGGTSFQIIKISTIFAFGALQIALLVLWCLYSAERTRTAIAAAALSTADAVVFCLLSYREHAFSRRPSALLNVYLFFSVFFDAIRTRTLWLMNYDITIRAIFTASLGLKVLILLLEATEKRRYLSPDDQKLSPEETSGILNQSVFVWLNQLIATGFKKALLMDDLYPLNKELYAAHLKVKFRKSWDKARRQKKPSLLGVICKSLKWELLAPVPGRVCLVAFTFGQPLLLNRFITYLQEPESSNSANYGYGLILAYAVVYLGMALSTGFYWHRVYRSLTMIRGSLVSAIYEKTMEISITALENSQAVSLMSTDIQRIVDGLKFIHEIWANLLQVAIATWLLSREIGVACVAPVAVSLVSVLLTGGVAAIAGPRQAIWMKVLEKRVGITATMLSSMKGVKMSGLTTRLTGLIQKWRIDEIKSGTKFRDVLVYALTLGFSPQLLAPVMAFGIFVAKSETNEITLDTTRIFTSLSLILLLTTPLSQTLQSIPPLMGALGCIDRIQTFLLSESRMDHRTTTIPDNDQQSPDSLAIYQIKEKPDNTSDSDIFASSEKTATSQTSFEDQIDNRSAISIKNGTFGWSMEGKHVLNEINISIPRSKMTMIVGPVASGKSTLLKGLLSETLFCEGLVRMSSTSVAFCDQTPWLINATIQENIIGFSDFNAKWYTSVIQACVLESDLATLPKGDRTMVGSKGITLSGGQKQRVAIARAIYARKDIAIFDDVFSGLDATTQQLLFSRVFGVDGLLRNQGTTVVIATHAINLLPSADYIILLSAFGKIAEQGSFEELNRQEGYISSLALQQLKSDNFEMKQADAATQKKEPLFQDVQVDEIDRGNGDFSVYSYYFRTVGIPAMALFFFLEASYAVLATFPTIWLKWWSDSNAVNPNQSNGYYLGIYAAMQGSALLIIAAVGWHLCNIMIVSSGARLHKILLNSVMNAPMSFFAATDLGVTTNRFSQDMQLIDSELPISLLDLMAGVFVTIAQAVLIATSSVYVAISFPVLLIVFYFLQRFYLRTSRQLRLMDLETKSPLFSQFLESLSGLATMRAFGWQQQSQALNDQLLDTSQRPFYLLYMIQRWLTLILDLITAGLAVVVVTIAVELRHSTSPGFTGVALVNIISFADYLKYLIIVWTNLETALGAVSRIKTFEETTETEHLPHEITPPPEHWPQNGRIEIRGVSAAYKASDNNVLNDVNLSIRAGEKIGICGRSGSGKSTLILALFRMIELNSGSILVDDVDISTLPREAVRSGLIAIPQEPYFLSGTVRLNADPFCTATDEAVSEALTKVGLLDNFKEKGGLDAEFDIDMLSHGQRQLFCLARAMLCQSKVVVLDEATSSVDGETDKLMQRLIREEFANRTIIAVAHRLNTVLDFDRVVVLDKGVLLECDGPMALLARPSAFKALYDQYESAEEAVEEEETERIIEGGHNIEVGLADEDTETCDDVDNDNDDDEGPSAEINSSEPIQQMEDHGETSAMKERENSIKDEETEEIVEDATTEESIKDGKIEAAIKEDKGKEGIEEDKGEESIEEDKREKSIEDEETEESTKEEREKIVKVEDGQERGKDEKELRTSRSWLRLMIAHDQTKSENSLEGLPEAGPSETTGEEMGQ